MPTIYTLGQGFDSITGEGKEDTIFMNEILSPRNMIKNNTNSHNKDSRTESDDSMHVEYLDEQEDPPFMRHIIMPYDKVPPVYARRKEEGAVQLHVKYVANHHEALKALGISGNISVETPTTGASVDMRFANSLDFSDEKVTILVIGKFVSHINSLPKSSDLVINRKKFELALDNPQAFVESHGDQVVTEVKSGAAFYAAVTIHHTSQKNAMDLETGLRCKLGPSGVIGVEGRLNMQSTKILDRLNITIKIEHVGIPSLGIPNINSSIEDFVEYIKKFNVECIEAHKNNTLTHPIGYTARSYSALISKDILDYYVKGVSPHKNSESIAKSLRVITEHGKIAKELLRDLDILYSTANSVIGTVNRVQKKAMELVSELDVERQIQHMNNLSMPLEIYRELIQKCIRSVFFARTNLQYCRFSDQCTILEKNYNIKNIELSNHPNKLTLFDFYEKAKQLLFNYKDLITRLEMQVERAIRHLSANLLTVYYPVPSISSFKIASPRHFHLIPPDTSTSCRLKLQLMTYTRYHDNTIQTKPLDHIVFNILEKKERYSRYHQIIKNIKNGAIVDMNNMDKKKRYRVVFRLENGKNMCVKDLKESQGKDKKVKERGVVLKVDVLGVSALQIRQGKDALINFSKYGEYQEKLIKEEQENSMVPSRRPTLPSLNLYYFESREIPVNKGCYDEPLSSIGLYENISTGSAKLNIRQPLNDKKNKSESQLQALSLMSTKNSILNNKINISENYNLN